MYRYLSLLIVTSFLATTAWAQDPVTELEAALETNIPGEPEESEASEASEESAEAEPEAEEIDETGLDDQGFTDADDDFRPSEEVPTDVSIPFPTDI